MSQNSQITPSVTSKKGKKPHESFGQWFFSVWHGGVAVVVSLVVLGFVVGSVASLHPRRWINEKDIKSFLIKEVAHQRAVFAFIHGGACLLLAILTPTAKPRRRVSAPGEDKKNQIEGRKKQKFEKKRCNRIRGFIISVYAAFCVYYLFTGLQLFWHISSDTFYHFWNDTLLIAVEGLLFFGLYLELVEPAVEVTDVSVAALVRNRWFEFQHAVVIGIFSIIVVPAYYSYHYNQHGLAWSFMAVSACLSGVTLALVIGRLGSKRIDPGSLVLGLLFLYPVIRPLAAGFEDPFVQIFATTASFALKLLLWLVFMWASNTTILAEYVHTLSLPPEERQAD